MELVGKKVRIVSETTPGKGQCLYFLTWKLKKKVSKIQTVFLLGHDSSV